MGAKVTTPVTKMEDVTFAHFTDPDGNLITLTQRQAALRVAGVDLAGGGLAVVVLEDNRVVEAFRCEAFAEALLVDAQIVAVDIPIGIPEEGGRPADEAARKYVGPRASSVFTTPVRRVLEAETYAEARGVASELTGKSISAQSYALGRRILEVDEYARDGGASPRGADGGSGGRRLGAPAEGRAPLRPHRRSPAPHEPSAEIAL